MPRTSDAREKMIQSAALLFRERGVDGTSFADVLKHSGAPRGSVYYHFADGKQQLAEETIRWAGDLMVVAVSAALRDSDPVTAIRLFRRYWTEVLESSDFRAGCTIAAAAVEGVRDPEVTAIAGEVFAEWQRAVAAGFREHGIETERARSLSTLVISAIEGALILSRAQHSVAPLKRVSGELETLVGLALGAESAPASP